MWENDEVKELARKIRWDDDPYKIITEFEGDWTIFMENSIIDAFQLRLNPEIDVRKLTRIIMSDPKLGLRKELMIILRTLIGGGFRLYTQFADDIIEYANNDVLRGPIQEELEGMLEYCEDVIPFYAHLIKHPLFKNNSKLIEAVKSNRDGIRYSVLELPKNQNEFEAIIDIPELICNDDLIDAILEFMSYDTTSGNTMTYYTTIEPLKNKKDFWLMLYRKLEESKIALWAFQEPLNLEYLLIPSISDYENILVARKRLIEQIELRGWFLMRLSLVSEVYAAEGFNEDGHLSKYELAETYANFFTILGLEELDVPIKDVQKALQDIEWKGCSSTLRKDILAQVKKHSEMKEEGNS